MKTRQQRSPEEMRRYIAQEIEQINNEIERLRAVLETPGNGRHDASSPVRSTYEKSSKEIVVTR